MIVEPDELTVKRQHTPNLKEEDTYLIGILSQTIQTKFYKIMNYPEAQDPDAVPPLSAHSFVVKQVPLRFRLE